MLLLDLHDHQNTAAEILWGVWLLPLAMLVYRSRFLPRFLGVWLAFNGVAYVMMSFTGELLPQYQDKMISLSTPVRFGEMALMLWLVIKGSKPQPLYADWRPKPVRNQQCGGIDGRVACDGHIAPGMYADMVPYRPIYCRTLHRCSTFAFC